jgi:diacylglycerol kinase (ATP)
MIHAIINPVSGAGADPDAASRRAAMVKAAADRCGAQVEVRFTERAGHARDLAAAAVAAAASGVVVWGGDGTFNEAGSALVGTSIPIGLVPAGSGNGLAGALGTPREPQHALPVAFTGTPKRIDAGRLGDRFFFNVAGIGFDARVAALFNQRAAGSRGGWPYIVIGVREGCRYCALDYEIRLDDESTRHRALLIVFANGREYGLGARIAPDAKLDDGLLDVLIAEDRGVVARFWSARYFARGIPGRAPRVTTRRIRSAVVEAAGEMEFHVDGEPGRASGRLDVEVLPGALTIRTV